MLKNEKDNYSYEYFINEMRLCLNNTVKMEQLFQKYIVIKESTTDLNYNLYFDELNSVFIIESGNEHLNGHLNAYQNIINTISPNLLTYILKDKSIINSDLTVFTNFKVYIEKIVYNFIERYYKTLFLTQKGKESEFYVSGINDRNHYSFNFQVALDVAPYIFADEVRYLDEEIFNFSIQENTRELFFDNWKKYAFDKNATEHLQTYTSLEKYANNQNIYKRFVFSNIDGMTNHIKILYTLDKLNDIKNYISSLESLGVQFLYDPSYDNDKFSINDSNNMNIETDTDQAAHDFIDYLKTLDLYLNNSISA